MYQSSTSEKMTQFEKMFIWFLVLVSLPFALSFFLFAANDGIGFFFVAALSLYAVTCLGLAALHPVGIWAYTGLFALSLIWPMYDAILFETGFYRTSLSNAWSLYYIWIRFWNSLTDHTYHVYSVQLAWIAFLAYLWIPRTRRLFQRTD